MLPAASNPATHANKSGYRAVANCRSDADAVIEAAPSPSMGHDAGIIALLKQRARRR